VQQIHLSVAGLADAIGQPHLAVANERFVEQRGGEVSLCAGGIDVDVVVSLLQASLDAAGVLQQGQRGGEGFETPAP